MGFASGCGEGEDDGRGRDKRRTKGKLSGRAVKVWVWVWMWMWMSGTLGWRRADELGGLRGRVWCRTGVHVEPCLCCSGLSMPVKILNSLSPSYTEIRHDLERSRRNEGTDP
jgi:hypothetical protein